MLIYLFSVDSSLGRLDYAMLSDQACVEIFFADCSPYQKYHFGITANQSEPSSYVDVCEWPGSKCDEEGNVIEIDMDGIGYTIIQQQETCMFNFAYIPQKVTRFFMRYYTSNTSIKMSDLPPAIEKFTLIGMSVHCMFEVKDMPRSLILFHVKENRFEGSCDLTSLPSKLYSFTASINSLSGTIDMNHLPPEMQYLTLSQNTLEGTLDIAHLPDKIYIIDLSKNCFSGKLSVTCVPISLSELSVADNKLSGTAVILKEINGSRCLLNLDNNMLVAIQDEKGRKHRFSARKLKTQIHA